MTEYWKSVGNYYCDYCKTFVRNDAFNKRTHEASDRHQNALKRQVRNLHKKHETEQREQARTNRELARMGGKVAVLEKQTSKETGPKAVNIGVKPKKTRSVLEDAEVQRQALAAQAMPGSWSTIETPMSQQAMDPAKETEVKDEVQEDIKPDGAITATDAQILPTDKADLPKTMDSALKRAREGVDDDVINFKVVVRETTVAKEAKADPGPAVAFKKRKPKTRPSKT